MNDHYLTYRAEDFAADDAFIKWVKGYSSDQQAWESWIREYPGLSIEIESAKVLVQAMSFQEDEQTIIDKEALWDRIDSATTTQGRILPAHRRRTHPLWYVLPIAAAASIALLLLLNIFGNDLEEAETLRGERLTQVLPGGSQVQLNAASKVIWNPTEWKQQRRLTLEGEAFFDVKKGATFVVETSVGNVRVLGTSFNVYQRGNELEVKCVTGKVEVTSPNIDESVVLTPGEGIAIHEALDPNRIRFDTGSGIGWLNSTFSFRDEELGDILDEIERQYDVEIEASDEIRSVRFNITFQKDRLDSTLYMICWPNNFEYQIDSEQKKVIIKKK